MYRVYLFDKNNVFHACNICERNRIYNAGMNVVAPDRKLGETLSDIMIQDYKKLY